MEEVFIFIHAKIADYEIQYPSTVLMNQLLQNISQK